MNGDTQGQRGQDKFGLKRAGYRGSGGSCVVVLLAPKFKHGRLNYTEVC